MNPGEPSSLYFIEVGRHILVRLMESAEVPFLYRRLTAPIGWFGLRGRGNAPGAEHGMRSIEGNAQTLPIAPCNGPLLHNSAPVHNELERTSRRATCMASNHAPICKQAR